MRFLPFATLSLCIVCGLIARLTENNGDSLGGFLIFGLISFVATAIYARVYESK